MIQQINLALADATPARVSILDTLSVQVEAGRESWNDSALWCSAKQHPATAALPALAEAQMAHIRAVTGLTRKVVVVDLDNTLWGGIVGEDGIDGIRIGPGSPDGEAYAALQDYLLELRERGVLLAVCSKNNPDDARMPFERHPQMRLRMEHFAAFVANWRDKVENLRTIASTLSLGTDSFVFLDDNPVERAWVRSQLPEIAVVELGPSAFTYVRELDRLRLFHMTALTEEDRRRTELYREAAAREAARASAESLEEFLQQLGMRSTDVPIGPTNLQRVTQLINKTNQFNLTTRRRTEAAVAHLAADDTGWARAFHLSDRFGDHGLIGVLICTAPSPELWEIDTWLMSCRVLGRRVEQFMFERLCQAALTAGITRLVGVYRPTAKNAQVANLYSRLGFSPVATDADEQRFELPLGEAAPAMSPTFIERVPA
jgi:FkbH-like protein